MAITDAPVVTIDGITLAASWSTTRRIALGGLAIAWGRTSHLERAKAAQLRIEVLDTDGHLASASHLTGKPVTVTRADGRVIFRGRIDDYEVEHTWLTDPVNQSRRRVWRLMLSAADKLAELAQLVPPGPYNEVAGVAMLGPNYWAVQRPGTRLAELLSSVRPIVDAIGWADPYPSGPFFPYMRHRAFADGLSALEHIEAVYQAVPLGYVQYIPATNTIAVGRPGTSSGLRLEWTGGKLRLTLPSGQVIPARDVAVPNGYRARTGINEAIDVVQVTSPRPRDATGLDTIDVTVERGTAHYNLAAGGRREHRVANDVWFTLEVPPVDDKFEWPFPLSNVSSEYGERPDLGSGFHTGIDFAGGSAAAGAAIRAAAPGTVVASRTHPDWGNNVVIDHGVDSTGAQLTTVYCHLRDPGVPPGTVVTRGQTIGYVGNTGYSTGPHLHYETLVNGAHVNPRGFMQERAIGAGAAPTMPQGEWQNALTRDTAALLDQINGKVTLPTIRLDWRHFDYADAVASHLIDTFAKNVPLYFPGSVFNVVTDAATAHQIIGGTLVYHDGWTLDATLAPTVGTGTGVTVAQLVTRDEPTLADFADDITIADLGNVTQGAAA